MVRRLDLKSEKTAVPIYEGFGSSYEKARAAIEAMKLHHPARRLIVIFEPHTFTWRNRDALHYYDDAFRGSDLTLIYEPATQGAETHKQLSQGEIVERVQASGTTAHAIRSKEDGLAILEDQVTDNDVILLLTSGDLGGLIGGTVALAEKKFPKQ